MKKILITLMLLVGAFSGFSQTFDFSCAPDEMGEGWELYRNDVLIIDGDRWEQTDSELEQYDAPASLLVNGLNLLRIEQGDTSEGTYTVTTQNVIVDSDARRVTLQAAIDYVRDIPYFSDGVARYDHPGIDGASSYDPSTNILMVEGVLFPTNGDFQATWSHRAPSNWAIGNRVVRFDISDGNYGVGFHADGGVPTGLTGSRDFAEQIRNLLTHRRIVLDNIVSGLNIYNPNPGSRALHINGEDWTIQADSFTLSGDYFSNSIGTATITPNTNGEDSFSISFHGGSTDPAGSSGLTLAAMAIKLMEYLPTPRITSGQDYYDPETGDIVIAGRSWNREGTSNIYNSPSDLLLDNHTFTIASIGVVNNREGFDYTISVGTDSGGSGAANVNFASIATEARRLLWREQERNLAIYNSRAANGEGSFTVRGIGWDRSRITNGTRFNAPQGIRDIDRWARISFDVLDNGTYRFAWQNDGGSGNCGTFPGGCGDQDDSGPLSYNAAVDRINSILPSSIFFVDRDRIYVNNRVLTNHEGGNSAGFTSEPISGVTYPGLIRFTRTGDDAFTIILIKSNVAKTYRTDWSEETIVGSIVDVATRFNAIYNAIEAEDSYTHSSRRFVYDGEVWARSNPQFATETDLFTPPSSQSFSGNPTVRRLETGYFRLRNSNSGSDTYTSFALLVNELDRRRQ